MKEEDEDLTNSEQNEAENGDNTWAQTVFTVTPEADATLQEFSESAVISGKSGTNLNTNDVVYGTKNTQQKQDAENQTYLQGVPEVHVPIEYHSEASQTMYMSSPCPPLKYFKDVMIAMNDSPMPSLNKSSTAQTMITLDPGMKQQNVIDVLYLGVGRTDDEENEAEIIEEKIQIEDFLNFILNRVLWISDMAEQTPVEVKDEETQTIITFNSLTNKISLDSETQTGLTCKPKESNTKLLADYFATKDAIRLLLEESLERGIEPRIIVDDVIDEIIQNCAGRIKYPMKDQSTQTLATYKVVGEKDEEVLRKLRLPIVVDPLEASIVAVPLLDQILNDVCEIVFENAQRVAEDLMKIMFRKSSTIGQKLQEIRKESLPWSMDEMFDRRRKKIFASMEKKVMEDTSAQTGIAGVPEVQKITEPKETVCSVCTRHSRCYWCVAAQEAKDLPLEEVKIRRTQDILLTYKPCYIVATPSEQARNLRMQDPCPKKGRAKKEVMQAEHIISEHSNDRSSESIQIVPSPPVEITPQDSLSGWGDVVDNVLSKPWSIQGSESDTSGKSRTSRKKTSRPAVGLTSETAQALEILRSTFCTRDTCTVSSLKTSCKTSICNKQITATNDEKEEESENIACYPEICEVLLNAREKSRKRSFHSRNVSAKNSRQLPAKIKEDILNIFY